MEAPLRGTVYTYLRGGERAALRRSDIDLEHRVILVHRSVDRFHARGRVKSTKTGVARGVPIEREIFPLIESLCEGLASDEPLFVLPPAEDLANRLREHLKLAKVERESHYANEPRRTSRS